jgi:hypothetical protein
MYEVLLGSGRNDVYEVGTGILSGERWLQDVGYALSR